MLDISRGKGCAKRYSAGSEHCIHPKRTGAADRVEQTGGFQALGLGKRHYPVIDKRTD